MNLTEGDDSLLRLLHITSWLASDIISYSGMMFCLLHNELGDYSLGQIAFAVFISYHTAALPCKHIVNKRL